MDKYTTQGAQLEDQVDLQTELEVGTRSTYKDLRMQGLWLWRALNPRPVGERTASVSWLTGEPTTPEVDMEERKGAS